MAEQAFPNPLDVAARRRLTDAGLRVVCSRGLACDADISSADLTIVERGEKLLHDSLLITAELGGTHFTGALHSALGRYHRPLSDAGRRNVVAVLGRLARQARGITLGLVICNRYETNVVNTARQALLLAAGLSNDLAIWRNLWSDGEDLARHARIFIANHLTAAGAS